MGTSASELFLRTADVSIQAELSSLFLIDVIHVVGFASSQASAPKVREGESCLFSCPGSVATAVPSLQALVVQC